ncbi:MAG: OadG family transporter subunit [Dysgonamonadaceae bacterium]|nr:OadG family transporter subunit [Dysgonamonadaceae bacterium]MDD3355441.1 OadG family transporter subunit [Dysgonamonadaceae bacterium]MDD3727422.1 OadG family transporter subunit [Dysgonamonadaceae bacterium]MDD4245535.1 OadG family transporter subunit [Dysgonamonadaceae bacterium]MDD4604804.1 OadG family transporter subunit [Dysgonamonadaceae bacterium]
MTEKIKLSILVISLLLLAGCNKNIEHPDWVINEVMVNNKTNFIDDFGERHAWIEIYNNTARTQNLTGAFLTNDPNNPKKYPIPQGDVKTIVKPHQHVVFWADNMPSKGTFHLNFKLDPDKENYIALYELDGKTLLDKITIPAGIPADKTYGYEADGIESDQAGNYLGKVLDRVTPGSNNMVIGENPKIVSLKKNDPWGVMITITSMLVVFLGLIVLYFVFKFTGRIAKRLTRLNAIRSGKLSAYKTHEISGEVLAAISAAIYEMDQDVHDKESTILTIDEVKRTYSPWSSKIYNMRQLPK